MTAAVLFIGRARLKRGMLFLHQCVTLFHCECLACVCDVQNQPFLKLLSMLVELPGGPPGMPLFMNYVLQKFWEVRSLATNFSRIELIRVRNLC